jgi:hypothetical protein
VPPASLSITAQGAISLGPHSILPEGPIGPCEGIDNEGGVCCHALMKAPDECVWPQHVILGSGMGACVSCVMVSPGVRPGEDVAGMARHGWRLNCHGPCGIYQEAGTSIGSDLPA